MCDCLRDTVHLEQSINHICIDCEIRKPHHLAGIIVFNFDVVSLVNAG
jgi:hypothetical protein